MMRKRALTIEAKVEATQDECWMTCRVGRKKYKTHWRRESDGVLSLQSGTDVEDLFDDDWVKELLEVLEEGARELMSEV